MLKLTRSLFFQAEDKERVNEQGDEQLIPLTSREEYGSSEVSEDEAGNLGKNFEF